MRPTVVTLISLALAVRCAASQETSNQGVLFWWGTINVALAPDTAEGLRFLSATTLQAGPAVGQRGFESRFIPDSALAWAAHADSFLAHAPDTGWAISRPLTDRRGAGIVLALHREKAGGRVEQYLVLLRAGGRALLRIQLTGDAGPAFLRGLREQAPRARWAPAPPKVVAAARVAPVGPVDTTVGQQPPELLRGPMLHYPENLRQEGIMGAVWARFIVDSAGHPDPTTVRILFSSDIGFTEEVRRWARDAVFRPAALYGHPIATMVEMPFTFTLH